MDDVRSVSTCASIAHCQKGRRTLKKEMASIIAESSLQSQFDSQSMANMKEGRSVRAIDERVTGHNAIIAAQKDVDFRQQIELTGENARQEASHYHHQMSLNPEGMN